MQLCGDNNVFFFYCLYGNKNSPNPNAYGPTRRHEMLYEVSTYLKLAQPQEKLSRASLFKNEY